MALFDEVYRSLVQQVLSNGTDCESRGLKYRQLFGVDFTVDLRSTTPLLTLRKLPLRSIVDELLWDIQGRSTIEELGSAKHFWSFLTGPSDDGVLRGSYGKAWRAYPSSDSLNKTARGQERYAASDVDQLANVIKALRECPQSRQIQITTHMPALTNYACPPCHPGLILSSDGVHLDMLVISRSNDLAFGTPLDVARYSIIQMWLAALSSLTPRFHKHSIANLHIYDCNREELRELCEREAGEPGKVRIALNPLDDFAPVISIKGYSAPSGPLKLSQAALK